MRFYGTEQCMHTWRDVVTARTGKPCGPVQVEFDVIERHYFEVDLTNEDREELMKDWYEVEPGQDLRWNLRVTFLE